jgi:F-type H+-transporting ATPase subunit delta
MIKGSLPRRYAKALAEIAMEDDQLIEYGKELHGLAEVFRQAPEALASLASKVLPAKERKQATITICKKAELPQVLQNFILFLVDRERIGILLDIERAYQEYQDKHLGILRTKVTTLKTLDGEHTKKIEDILSKMTGKQVVATVAADPSILGGLVLQLDSQIYDGSVRSALSRVRQKMIAETL